MNGREMTALERSVEAREIRALVVEDDPSWQQILVEILTDAGLVVDLAGNLDAAVEKIRCFPHRLAVLDLSLGGRDHHNQDGLRVSEAIRSHDPGCSTLFLTGFATVELAVSVIQEHGAVTCLRKETFRRSEFRQLVSQILSSPPPLAAPQREKPLVAPAAPPPARLADKHPADKEHPADKSPADSYPADEEHPADRHPAETGQGSPQTGLGQVLVVEDDAGWRSLFRELLEDAGYRVEGSSSYGEALGKLKRNHYALAVVDLSLASSLEPKTNLDGYRLLASTRKAGIPTIVVSGFAAAERIEMAFAEHNIFACLEKRLFDRDAFLQTVEKARLAQKDGSTLEKLTERERKVLALLAQGLANKEIARALYITPNTVKRHLKSIFEKLGVHSRAAASARAISSGLEIET